MAAFGVWLSSHLAHGHISACKLAAAVSAMKAKKYLAKAGENQSVQPQ